MSNTYHQTHMGGNDPDQSMDAKSVSQTVKEVLYNTTDQITSMIDRLILFYHYNVRFVQAEPWPPDEQRFVHNRYRTKALKCFAIVVLLLAVILGSIRRVHNTPPLNIEDTSVDNYQRLTMKVGEKCDCSNSILEDELGTNTDDEIIDLFIYDELNVADMLKEISTTEHVDNSTCALYDVFLYVFTKLCSVTDNIIAILPNESQDDIYSTDDNNGKPGQTSLATDNFPSSKTEQNGVVSSEDTHLTNIHILKKTNPVNSSEKFLEKQAV